MGMNNPDDPIIELARAQERLKNSAQLRREVVSLSTALKTVTNERNRLHEELEVEKKQSEYLLVALNGASGKYGILEEGAG